jgi:hypothetical protein
MAAACVLTPRASRLGILLVVAVIAAALSGLSPAAANPAANGGTPTPAGGVLMPAGGKPMPAAAPSQGPAAVDRKIAEVLRANPGSRRISDTSVLLEPGVVMTVPGPVKAGATMTVPTQDGRQVVVSAADTSCAYQFLCVWEHVWRGGAKLAFYYCNWVWLGDYWLNVNNNWRDDISSIWNNQSGGAVSYFYNVKYGGYDLIGTLSAGNYLMDLTRDRARDGGTWNDRIDRLKPC